MAIWTIHGDGKRVAPGSVVRPGERLSWPRTVSVGLQHVVAMFGATFLVPLLTGFPPATTLFFSAVGTALFLLITGNKLPSYLGSSFAFIAPLAATTGYDASSGVPIDPAKMALGMGGVVMAGVLLAIVGGIAHIAGSRWIDALMPPMVTGAIVALIGLNLAPTAWSNFSGAPLTAGITVVAVVVITVLFRGMLGRLSILLGVLVGYAAAWIQDITGFTAAHVPGPKGEYAPQLDFSAVAKADWIGLPQFHTPSFNFSLVGLFLPVVLVLIAENVGHVKSVAAMTGEDYNKLTGRALLADGVATIVAGTGGGSGTTTYAENIGVMAATRIYSTAVYWVAAATALALSLMPKFGALINTIPGGVLGGAGTVLYGMIGILGARIWVQNKVDFSSPVNLMTAAVALVAGIANFTFAIGSVTLGGIAVGSIAAIAIYHLMRVIAKWRGTEHDEPVSPGSVPGGAELERQA